MSRGRGARSGEMRGPKSDSPLEGGQGDVKIGIS